MMNADQMSPEEIADAIRLHESMTEAEKRECQEMLDYYEKLGITGKALDEEFACSGDDEEYE